MATDYTWVDIRNIKEHLDKNIIIKGWLQNRRDGKGIVFAIIRDGSGMVQCVGTEEILGEANFNQLKKLGLESSIIFKGKANADERQMGGVEVQIESIEIVSEAIDYPIGKKEHGVDFLINRRHLWLRSQRQWAIMKVRNSIIFNIHNFFQEKGFVQMDAPIFTGNACEGTSTLFETNYFEETAYLSQSGQLYGEAMAMAMGKIYTFGPVFRAEKSKTRRHLSEFWMIEPEMAWYNLEMTMDLIEDFLRYVVLKTIDECRFELVEVLKRDLTKLEWVKNKFIRLPYSEAVQIIKGFKDVNGNNSIKLLESQLEAVENRIKEINEDIAKRESDLKAGGMKKGAITFNEEKIRQLKVELADLEEEQRNIPVWLNSAKTFVDGNDFGGSDETVLTNLFEGPVMVYNWPKEVKAFYMKEADDAKGFVCGVDVLAPEGYGEIVGGGERETDINRLIEQIHKHELPMEEFEWYLDLRKYGSVPHSGFGLGLERMVSWICKLPHVREAIPFPRYMGRLLP
jgi:asparaginyl-tRNA synthetase